MVTGKQLPPSKVRSNSHHRGQLTTHIFSQSPLALGVEVENLISENAANQIVSIGSHSK